MPAQNKKEDNKHGMILVRVSSFYLTPQKTYCDIKYIGLSNSITHPQKTGEIA